MKRVLLVHSHEVFREALSLLLEHHTEFGESVQASSLDEARQSLNGPESLPDLALIDLDILNGDACEFIEYLHRDGSGVPVMTITEGHDLERQVQALEAGAVEVFTTAVSSEEIISVARQLEGG